MKLEKIVGRLELLSEELESLLRRKEVSTDVRMRAGRSFIDLLEDYSFCVDNDVTKDVLHDVMKEYEKSTMEIYKSI